MIPDSHGTPLEELRRKWEAAFIKAIEDGVASLRGRRIGFLPDSRIVDAVNTERQRCLDIVHAARMGEIDSDLRCIRSRIESGEPMGKP